mmetsp:Transcript_15792/g.44191  ORF Transcript_15792/g.44191 Transcript_15792/m.44191 type:complete len:486 (+) Transcript_15792:226-1683(+)|eukprot:CAMPEP_0117677348 /NCGR_PEP_ID=MMETSP0804-20121206/16697_1 /TAXON_ID=1074897 /ORGANISM="Tetraselmis astigmatica, Strain CCMP880" /LENGTH=485 /DNA_ID=CAMNT_0005486625 /DNA_START=162 /DNA_END=1619 /DNA_ORIENTATION=-
MFPGHKKLPPDHRILKIREYEDQLAKYQQNSKTQLRLNNIATWEDMTSNKITQRTINNRFETLKGQRENELDARRERLAKKLFTEEKALQDELLASRPTAEENRKKLTDKARQLAHAREMERQKLANSLMMQHFRENCDPIREQDSKKLLQQAVKAREQQLDEARMLTEMEKAERHMYDEMWERERLKKEQRYQDDLRRTREGNAAMTRVLDEQMVRVAQRKAEEQAGRESEIALLHAQWKAADEAAANAEAARRDREATRIREVKAFNELKAAMDQQRADDEYQEDLKFVTMAMQKAAEDEARDRDAKEQRRKETQEFRRQLTELAVREAEDNSAQDAMISEASARQQAKYDAEQEAKEVARRKLLQEVLAERRQQVEEKMRTLELMKEHDRAEMERAREEAIELNFLEEELRIKDQQQKMQARLDIQAQIWAKEQRAAAEEEERYREAENARAAEAQYLGVVKEVEAMPAREDFRRKKVEWYY